MWDYILFFFLELSLLFWISYVLRTMSNYRKLPNLSKVTSKIKSKNLPFVSVIVPARNEEKRIGQFLKTLQKQTYPHLEILIMDDYSTDKTAEIAKSIIDKDKRFKILSLKSIKEEKPSGWVGKSYAIQQGSTNTRGEWFLFCDVDYIDYDPNLIERAVEYAIENKIDLLSLVPRNVCKSFWEKVIQPIPAGLLIFLLPFAKVNDPKSKASFALGLFILIKRPVFNKVGGYETIKGCIADDAEMAKLVKDSGFKIGLAHAQNMMRFRMYDCLSEIWEGWSKNIFLGLIQKRRIQSKMLQILVVLVGTFGIFETTVLPFLAVILSLLVNLFMPSPLWFYLLLFSISIWLYASFVQFYVHRHYSIGAPRYAPLYFLGGIITIGIFLNSAFKILMSLGITWKQRKYFDKTS